MPELIVRKETGELLFDTSKITYGLVKSGNMVYLRSDGVYIIRGSNVDPEQKSSYNYNAGKYPIHGFTVSNAKSPIVFIVGRGCLVSTARSGDSVTFYYASASTDTKYYCFDLMADDIPGSPYLKTFLNNGVCTFNSLQPPLNIAGAVQAPGPGSVWPNGRYRETYAGGVMTRLSYYSMSQASGANIACIVNIDVGGGECAVFLPWSRTATVIDVEAWSFTQPWSYGVAEGAYGRVGGISFIFAATTEGIFSQYVGAGAYSPASYVNLPTDRYPQALYIRTAGLPFPYR